MAPGMHSGQVDALARRILALPESEREAAIQELCPQGVDAALVREALTALQHSESTVTFLAADSPRDFVPGAIIANRFRIEALVGKGGMGEVYAAHDLELGGRVALKTVHRDFADHPDAFARFRREIQLARQVTHPNVCRVFDVGHDTVADREIVFFTMEYLPGQTLSHRIRSGLPLDAADARALASQLIAGLGALHERGLVHRDLKPANVMISSEGRVVLMDFGLARRTDSPDQLTRANAVLGTVAYMAPEQLRGEPATQSSDIYALGLILSEIAASADSQSLDAVARQCAQRDPADRPGNAADILSLLDGSFTEPAIQKPTRRWWAAGIAVASVAGAGTWFAMHSARPSSLPPATSSVSVRDLLVRSDKPGNLDKAFARLNETMSQGPGSEAALVHYELGWADSLRFDRTRDKADLDRAESQYLEAIHIDQDLADAHARLSRIYDYTGRANLAEQEAKAALKIDPKSATAWNSEARILGRAGRAKDAEDAFRKAIDLSPEEWQWHDSLGNFLRNQGRFADAKKELNEAVRLTPDNVQALTDRAVLAVSESQYADAQRLYERCINIAPSFEAYTGLGAALMLQKDYPRAKGAFHEAVTLKPDNYTAWANLGSAATWSGDSQNAAAAYKKAAELAETQRSLSPKNAILIATLGGYYAALQQPEKAIPLLRQSVALDSESPQVTYRAGEAYEILHRRKEALQWIGRAIALGFSRNYIDQSPELAALRADSRFQRLAKK